MTSVIRILLALPLLFVGTCAGAKILGIFPTGSYSHQISYLAVTRALAERGHDLTVITTAPFKLPVKNHREIDVSDQFVNGSDIERRVGFSTQERTTGFRFANCLYNFIDFIVPAVMDSKQIQALMREINGTKFDLIIYEMMFYSSLLGFGSLVGNPPVIAMTSFHPLEMNDVVFGNPLDPSHMPAPSMPYEPNMSLYERLRNHVYHLNFFFRRYWASALSDRLLLKYFGDIGHTAYELERNASLLLVCTDMATAYPKPVFPNTIFVGPTHIVKPLPMAPDLQKWMDEAKDGVVYFSMGGNMRSTTYSEEKIAAFVKTFSQFPKLRIVWKWEADQEVPGKPANVFNGHWLPQQSILAHPNTKLFISHSGMQSMQEAVEYAVPVLAIPMFTDQDFNAKKLEVTGTGIMMEYNDLNYEDFYANFKEMVTNNSYKENMKRLSYIVRDRPKPPVETAIWWIEYVLRHNGAPHLKPYVNNVYWYQENGKDLWALTILLASSLVLLLRPVFRKTLEKLKRD